MFNTIAQVYAVVIDLPEGFQLKDQHLIIPLLYNTISKNLQIVS